MLDAFLEENPDATEEDLYLALGSPEELAEQMMEECKSKQFYSPLKQHITKFIATSIILGIALLYVSVLAYTQWKLNGQIEINPVEYIYPEDSPKPFSSFVLTDADYE